VAELDKILKEVYKCINRQAEKGGARG